MAKCQLFLGILGERYGWIPDKYHIPIASDYDWLREYPPGASVTELEIYQAALAKPHLVQDKAFFYFRQPAFIKFVNFFKIFFLK